MTKTDFLKKQFGLIDLPDLTYKQYFTFGELHTLLEEYEKAINYSRCCETFYCLNKSVYGESSKCLEQCLACRKK